MFLIVLLIVGALVCASFIICFFVFLKKSESECLKQGLLFDQLALFSWISVVAVPVCFILWAVELGLQEQKLVVPPVLIFVRHLAITVFYLFCLRRLFVWLSQAKHVKDRRRALLSLVAAREEEVDRRLAFDDEIDVDADADDSGGGDSEGSSSSASVSASSSTDTTPRRRLSSTSSSTSSPRRAVTASGGRYSSTTIRSQSGSLLHPRPPLAVSPRFASSSSSSSSTRRRQSAADVPVVVVDADDTGTQVKRLFHSDSSRHYGPPRKTASDVGEIGRDLANVRRGERRRRKPKPVEIDADASDSDQDDGLSLRRRRSSFRRQNSSRRSPAERHVTFSSSRRHSPVSAATTTAAAAAAATVDAGADSINPFAFAARCEFSACVAAYIQTVALPPPPAPAAADKRNERRTGCCCCCCQRWRWCGLVTQSLFLVLVALVLALITFVRPLGRVDGGPSFALAWFHAVVGVVPGLVLAGASFAVLARTSVAGLHRDRLWISLELRWFPVLAGFGLLTNLFAFTLPLDAGYEACVFLFVGALTLAIAAPISKRLWLLSRLEAQLFDVTAARAETAAALGLVVSGDPAADSKAVTSHLLPLNKLAWIRALRRADSLGLLDRAVLFLAAAKSCYLNPRKSLVRAVYRLFFTPNASGVGGTGVGGGSGAASTASEWSLIPLLSQQSVQSVHDRYKLLLLRSTANSTKKEKASTQDDDDDDDNDDGTTSNGGGGSGKSAATNDDDGFSDWDQERQASIVFSEPLTELARLLYAMYIFMPSAQTSATSASTSSVYRSRSSVSADAAASSSGGSSHGSSGRGSHVNSKTGTHVNSKTGTSGSSSRLSQSKGSRRASTQLNRRRSSR